MERYKNGPEGTAGDEGFGAEVSVVTESKESEILKKSTEGAANEAIEASSERAEVAPAEKGQGYIDLFKADASETLKNMFSDFDATATTVLTAVSSAGLFATVPGLSVSPEIKVGLLFMAASNIAWRTILAKENMG